MLGHHHEPRPADALAGVGPMGGEDLADQGPVAVAPEGLLNLPGHGLGLLKSIEARDGSQGVLDRSRHGLMLR